uniref:Autophagy-related protein 2 n=1 Tax=Panstrongylus lignarius TaxID=156445 RepID=A0A224XCK3_9HEMI
MSWYTQWSDSIKKRACRYLLQRYLGQFLEEKLTLDQLSVDIYCGTGSVSNVGIDVQALNDLGDEKNLPVEFVDGFVSEISVSIPWATLFSDSIYVEVSGLHVTVQPKQRPDNAGSMFESMWSSMASSIQLAAECLKHESTIVDGTEQDTETNMDGLEIFAHAIESILTRVKIKLMNTSVRLEHVPKEGKNGIAFELRISNVEYCDETSCEAASSTDCPNEPQPASSFSIKKFHCEGVSFYTDEFPVGGRTFSRAVAQTQSFQAKNLNCDKYVNETDSIIVAKLSGLQEVRVKLKLDPSAVGPKVDLEFNLGLLTVFLSPRQLYLLFEIFNSLISPHTQDTSNVSSKRSLGEKLMSSKDFKKVEQELQDTLNFPIFNTNVPRVCQGKGWSSPSFDEGEEEYFLPMKLTNSLTGSVISDKTNDTSFTSNTSLPYYSTKMDSPFSYEGYPQLYNSGQKKMEKGCEAEIHEETSSYHISLGGIVVALLTEDLLTFGMDTSCLTPSSVSVMTSQAKQFFDRIPSFGFSPRSFSKDFCTSEKCFVDTTACSLNHIRLLATSVIIEGSDGGNANTNVFSTTISAANLEILECLVEKNPSFNGKVQLVELLKFMRSTTAGNLKPHFPISNQPDLRMHVQHIKKRQRSKLSSNLIVSLNLEQCWSELDLSIFDRISTITNPQTLCQVNATPREVMDQHSSFTQAVENSALCDKSYIFKIQSPFFIVKFRFPIPDLRPVHEKGKLPELQRSVRNDILFVNLIEPQFFTEIITKIPIQEYFLSCKQILVSFQEGDIDSAIPFIRATGLNASAQPGFSPENKSESPVRFSLRVCPLQVVGDVEECCEKEDNSGLSCSSFMDQPSKDPSPFMSKRVIHESNTHHHSACEGEELIMPGSKEDMHKFITNAQDNSKIQVVINLPNLSVVFSTKHLYEVIYNRLTSDLSLWHSNGLHHSRNKTLSSQFDLTPLLQPSFSLCKSALQFESDDSEEEDVSPYKTIHKGETSSQYGQSHFSINIHVNKGSLNICPNTKDEKGNVCPDKYGEMLFTLQEGNIFSVSNYKGKPLQNYICLQVNNMGVYHKAEVDVPRSEYILRMQTQSTSRVHLDPVLVKSNKEVIATSLSPEGAGANMLSTAISTTVNERKIKTVRVACSLSGATLRHRVARHHQSWLSHLMDFFDVVDYPVKGYESPQFITELYLHIWDSAIDYRPVNLPLRCLITLGNLSISSNITRAKTSTLRFIAEEASLFISDKIRKSCSEENFCPNLRADYVSVVQLGLLELSLRLTDLPNMPKVDLKASNNLVEIRTCADSATALAQLLRYYVSDGDLGIKVSNSETKGNGDACSRKRDKSQSSTSRTASIDPAAGTLLSDSTTERLHDMMEDAMKEISSLAQQTTEDVETKSDDVEVFYFPDEGTQQSYPIDWGENNLNQEHDFCVLEHETGEGVKGENGRPVIRLLTDQPVRIVDNHFSMCVGRTDSLLSPKYYPIPVSKYTLTDMTLVWHMYGGSDFCQPKKNVNFEQSATDAPSGLNRTPSDSSKVPRELPKSSTSSNTYFLDGLGNTMQQNRKRQSRMEKASWQLAGGPERKHSVLMQLQFNKVRFQHEIYPDKASQASREVLLIHEFEIRDRLSSSQINKFLYQYSSETNPRQSHANMLVIKAVHLRSDTHRNIQETCLKVSLLPLRLNIDQDSLQFLFTFFNQLSGLSITSEEDLGSALGTIHSTPIMGVTTSNAGTESTETAAAGSEVPSNRFQQSARSSPLFIRNFIFSPEVPIRIDYEGKRVDLTHGPLAGLLMGLAQLNCLQIRLKRLSYKHGLLGLDRLISYALTEWVNDIKKTQFPSLIGGVGPMHALVQLFQGIRDLFWLPIEQYQKDGRIVRGLQRGANSFTTSTAIAALELTARIVQAIQSIAEAAFDMVSPGPSVRRSHGSRCKKQHCYSHPSDIREGVANAYTLVKEGLGETAETLVRVASAEAEQKGAVGAVGGVLRQLPPTVVAPIILATAATSNLIGGVHSQLAPDSRREATLKWRATPKS